MKKYINISFIIITTLLMIFTLANSLSVKASMTDDIELIVTNPGENSSSEMRLSWHSQSSECKLYYTLANDESFNDAIVVTVKGDYSKTPYSGNTNYYKYSYTLSYLTSSTSYIYKIESSTMTSDVFKFKTAGVDGNTKFMLIGDIHANSGDKALKNAEGYVQTAEKSFGSFDFILCQGDITKYGERYSDWQQWNNSYILKNYMFADTPGNKEYYNISKAITSEKWFLAGFNNPNNGYENLPATYWFIYNNILFFSLDNINNSFHSYMDGVLLWMKNVITEQEGNYQYIIINKHYPDFIPSNTKDRSICDRGDYTQLNEFCTENNVDMVISGDDHCYTRSYMLYNDQVSTDELKGTYYLTACMVSPTSAYAMNITPSTNSYLEVVNRDATTGAEFFEVTKDSLTYSLFDVDGKVWDTVTIKAKRAFNYTNTKNDMMNSLNIFQSEDNSSAIIHYNPGFTGIIKQIIIAINNTTVKKLQPQNDGVYQYSLSNLKQGDNIQLTFTFVDSSTKKYNHTMNPKVDFGEIYGFNCAIKSNKLEFRFGADLKNNIVNKFELYKGENLIATLKPTETSYSADLSEVSNNTYYLKAIDSNENVLYIDYCNYFSYGDYNNDGKVTDGDYSKFVNAIIYGGDSTVKRHDANGDGVFDIIDLALINIKENGKDLVSNNTVTVKFVDINGSVIQTTKVKKGDNVTAPTVAEVSGYKFVGWDLSLKSIQKDVVIKAVYIMK